MSINTPQEHIRVSETQEKIPDIPIKSTMKNLDSIVQYIQKKPHDIRGIEIATDYVLKICQIDAKYTQKSDAIHQDIRHFVQYSLKNTLANHLSDVTIKKTDIDKNGSIDDAEESEYVHKMHDAIMQIIKIGGLEKFAQAQYQARNESGMDKTIAKYINASSLLEKEGGKNYAEVLLQKSRSMTEQELVNMKDQKFDITSASSYEALGILLVTDFGSGLEDIIRFIGSIPSSLVLMPRYLSLRKDTLTGDATTQVQAEIEKNLLVEKYPALGLPELLGEKGVEAVRYIGNLFTSGKVGDISQAIMMLAGLIAGAAGVSKLATMFARKTAVRGARRAGSESRKSGETTSRETRNAIKQATKQLENVEKKAGKIDDIISGGAIIGGLANMKNLRGQKAANDEVYGINQATGTDGYAISVPLNPQLRVIEGGRTRTSIAEGRIRDTSSAIKLNQEIGSQAKLSGIAEDAIRIQMIKKAFPELKDTIDSIQADLIKIHNINTGKESVGNYGISSLGQKMSQTIQVLEGVGIHHDEAKNITKRMIQEGYLGDLTNDVMTEFARYSAKGYGIIDFLESKKDIVLDVDLLRLLYKETPDRFSDPKELKDFLESFEINCDNFDILYKTTMTEGNAIRRNEFQTGKGVSYELLKQMDDMLSDKELLIAFFEYAKPGDIQMFIDKEILNRIDNRNFINIIEGNESIIQKLLTQDDIIASKIIQKLTGGQKGVLNPRVKNQIITRIQEFETHGVYQGDLSKSLIARFEAMVDNIAPEKNIEIFLKGEGNREELMHQLSNNTNLKQEWNKIFERSLDSYDIVKCGEMLKRGEVEFFSETQQMRIIDALFRMGPKAKELEKEFDIGGKYESIYRNWSESNQKLIFPERFR